MADRAIVKNFNNFRGKDSRSSDLVRDENFAIEFQNARVVKEDSCVNRQGSKIIGPNSQYCGLYSHVWTDTSTGDVEREVISLSDSLYRRKDSSLNVVYVGASSPVLLSLRLDTATQTFKCSITVAGTSVFSMDLGTGLEASPVTLATLSSTIDALADFTSSVTGTSSHPAAFVPITINRDLLSTGGSSIQIYEWEKMSTLSSAVFSEYFANRGLDSWELASCVNINNNLYIGTGYEYLHKYDGQNVYRAGMPFPDAAATLSLGAPGFGVTDTDIKYMYLYKQIDNRGNITLGVDADPSAEVSPANQIVDVTVKNILAATGFNTGGAVVNGAQSGVTTITVDSGHTLKVGDVAYFADGSSSSYVEREVLATTATTIQISGGTVNVADNAAISNNLRIVIYRTTNGGNLYYKVAEVPNNSFTATYVYPDSIVTANLGAQYIAPTKLRDPLEAKPKYLCLHQDILVAAGSKDFPMTWFYSNSEGPEYFDAEVNFEIVRSTAGGGIRGVGSDQEHLIVGSDSSLFVITGDLGENNIRQENLSRGHVGFSCHNSIVEMEGKILFLGKTGFWAIENGFNLYEIGEPINPELVLVGLASTQEPQFRRSFAIHMEETQEYVCFIPCESGSGVDKYANENSRVFIYDSFHRAWGDWTGLNMGGGLAYHDGKLLFQSKVSDPVLNVTGNLWQRSNLGQVDDYADHTEAIPFKFGTQWIDAGEPSVFKVYLWMKLYNLLRQVLIPSFTLTVKVERDFQRDVTWFEYPLVFGEGSASGWGLFQWGVATWGSFRAQIKKKKLRSGKAQALRYVMEHSRLHEKVAISAWETVVTAPYSTEMKS